MPIPLLIWGVAGVIAAVVAIKKGFFKKKVFIYGMKATGKTTFHRYCTTGKIITEYFPTGTGEFDKKEILEKTKEEWRKWISRGWTAIDSAGQDYTNRELTEIKDYIEAADVVLYFFRADEIANLTDRKRVLRTIKANILQYKQELGDKLILVATHTDLIPGFSRDMASRDWEKEIVLKDIIRLSSKHRIEYVSLTPEQIEVNAKHILDLIKEKN